MERETSSSSTPPEDLVTSMIGKFVAVLSNNDIRYEGVISLLNLQDSKLGLQNGNNSIPNPLQDLLFMIFFFSSSSYLFLWSLLEYFRENYTFHIYKTVSCDRLRPQIYVCSR